MRLVCSAMNTQSWAAVFGVQLEQIPSVVLNRDLVVCDVTSFLSTMFLFAFTESLFIERSSLVNNVPSFFMDY